MAKSSGGGGRTGGGGAGGITMSTIGDSLDKRVSGGAQSYAEYLANDTKLEAERGGYRLYRASNEYYVVTPQRRVLTAYGYNGPNLFNSLTSRRGREAFLRRQQEWADLLRR